MKSLICILVFTLSFNIFAKEVTIEDAPLEWLIVNTIAANMDKDGHIHFEDKLVQDIFQNIEYDAIADEMIITSNKNTHKLRKNLISFLKTQENNLQKNKQNIDEKFLAWKKEGPSLKKVRLFNIKKKYHHNGFYFFNHVHTDISQDNSSFKFLKYTPKETHSMIENFLKKRRTEGVVAFCDHDTDKAFDKVVNVDQSRLSTLRSIEWGGRHHMGLVGIKANWDLLDQGRQFQGRESIIKSRSSEGFRIVNHPYRRNPPFLYKDWLDADGVEVWNTIVEGAPLTIFNIRRSHNRKALDEWSAALGAGNKYTAVGGSDFHFAVPCLRDRTLHYPANFVPATDKENAKKYLHEGRVSFLTRPTAPKLNLTATSSLGTHHMGQRVQLLNGKVQIHLNADFSDARKKLGGICYNVINTFYKVFTFWKKRTWEVRFYNKAGDLIGKRSINPRKYHGGKHFRAQLELDIQPGQSELIRAEVWQITKKNNRVDLVAATNPIYFN